MVASLHAGLTRILDEGLDAVWARHQAAGDALQDGLEEMGLELFAAEGHRLPELTTVKVPDGVDSAAVRARAARAARHRDRRRRRRVRLHRVADRADGPQRPPRRGPAGAARRCRTCSAVTDRTSELVLRPMSQEEYVVWRESSERGYAAEIAVSRDLDPDAALAQSAGEFASLLPAGLASPDMHLFTALSWASTEPVGHRLVRAAPAGVRDIGLDLRHPPGRGPPGARARTRRSWRPCTTLRAASGPRR